MVHTIQLGVPSEQVLDFWETRLADHGFAGERGDGLLRFADWEVDEVDRPTAAVGMNECDGLAIGREDRAEVTPLGRAEPADGRE